MYSLYSAVLERTVVQVTTVYGIAGLLITSDFNAIMYKNETSRRTYN